MQTVSASDLAFVRRVLTPSYTVQEGAHASSIHCTSQTGMRKNGDDDDGQWQQAFAAFKKHFGRRLKEVYHNTSFCYTDFTIYISS